MKLNIDLGKYVITGTKHDLILNEKRKVTDEKSKNFGNEVLVRCGYYSKFEHLVKELCHREILAEMRAQGVERYAAQLKSEAELADETGWDGAAKFLISESEKVLAFAAQLRQEAAK